MLPALPRQPLELLVPRHPDEGCHQSQLALLALEENPRERERLAQLLRWGNATYCYFHHHEIIITEADYLEWLEGLPAKAQATMWALGFAEMGDSLPLRRYVLEKNDIGLKDFLKVVLSATDWQAYLAAGEAAHNPWLPALP
ncbi:hypothetical protein GCM10023172_29900 [Hymenobacter ginsengisoli]|uniref:Uncharacterized protein n=1 Tax=Hymenobacter ginsengisoli TaxID=1051626 RepID=A0ABP8QMC4_9BACT|nr:MULTISPECIES: hypothetical protein [unclassified Hymenobacter]MBO2033485.1 hypothetical protein [Hymenobacter sp. BT559]